MVRELDKQISNNYTRHSPRAKTPDEELDYIFNPDVSDNLFESFNKFHKDTEAQQEDELPLANSPPPRITAGVSSYKLTKSAAEVDFNVLNPPSTLVVPPGATPVRESTTLTPENDVLCGRGRKCKDHVLDLAARTSTCLPRGRTL